MQRPPGELVRGYTIALGTYGLLLLASALTLYSTAEAPQIEANERWVFVMAARLSLLIGLSVGVVVALRVRRSPYSRPATAAFSSFLLISFPVGTAFFLYWFFKVRTVETATLERRTTESP